MLWLIAPSLIGHLPQFRRSANRLPGEGSDGQRHATLSETKVTSVRPVQPVA
jgi:hypothetical protein